MKILVVEDSDAKYQSIVGGIRERFSDFSIVFSRSGSLIDYVRKINANRYDLIIFDIVLPRRDGEDSFDLSIDLMQETLGTLNEATRAVAVTELIAPEYDTLVRFNERMIPVLLYDEGRGLSGVYRLMDALNDVSKVDFLIICALDKEANAFEQTDLVLGPWRIGVGASSQRPASIGELRGYIFVLPRPGLVNAGLLTAKVIELYKPRVVAMSGICAGVKGECDFTDVLVPELAWDYQVGKFTSEGFKQETYQEVVDADIVGKIKHHCKTSGLVGEINAIILDGTAGKHSPAVRFGPIASGSAVVADADVAKGIENQQRKLIGIEMEISAVFAACRYSSCKPLFFAAKSVVDFADKDKSDEAHAWGANASAIFVSRILPVLLDP